MASRKNLITLNCHCEGRRGGPWQSLRLLRRSSLKNFLAMTGYTFPLLIIILAAYLRFYRIQENFIFSGEVGDNLLAIKNAYLAHQLPLLGPPTSHPWLSFGPLFYWFLIPFLLIGNFNPMVTTYFASVVSLITLGLNYFVVNKLFNKKAAVFSSLLIATSPLWVQFTRDARFFSFVLPFIYLLIWGLHKKNFFLVGLSLGIMLNFHYTPLIFIPVVLSFWKVQPWSRLNLNMKKFLTFFLGLLIPTLPLLIYDFNHGFNMSINLLMWIPYRILGFVGLYPKNTVSSSVVGENASSFFQFFNLSFLPNGNLLAIILLIAITIFVIRKIRQPLILLWLGWGLAALFIHGNPPLHYFLPLFPLPIIIFSLFLADLWKKDLGKMVVAGIFLILFFFNLKFYFSGKWYDLPQDKVWPGTFYLPYNLQLKVVQKIINDAHGQPYNLTRIGPDDYFVGNYAQNYQYLAWWLGNEPTGGKVKLRYTICEENSRLPKKGEKIFNVANVTVLKEP